jgi:hypothetical protein
LRLWCTNGGALTSNSRFLRARRFVPQEAFKQFKDTEDWRKDQNIIELFETIEVEEYEQTRRLVFLPFCPSKRSFQLTPR